MRLKMDEEIGNAIYIYCHFQAGVSALNKGPGQVMQQPRM